MADDKRDGDDLFEDLDKFFAPIKDVDWDEPDASRRPADPERGARRRAGGDPQSADRARREPEEPVGPAVADAADVVEDDDDDEAWYDTRGPGDDRGQRPSTTIPRSRRPRPRS